MLNVGHNLTTDVLTKGKIRDSVVAKASFTTRYITDKNPSSISQDRLPQ